MKIAYLCEPQFGGTYTFFRRLRPRLAERGVDFVCIPPYSVETFDGSPFEGAEGVEFLELPSELPAATEVLIRHVTDRAYDAVLILPGCDVLTTNLARYLPRELRCAARVALMSRGAYAPTRVVAEHLDGLFAVSHRVTHDLVQSWSISPERIRTIYNGAVLRSRPERVSADGRRPIRLIYTGRFSDIDKGTLMLPRIVQQASDRPSLRADYELQSSIGEGGIGIVYAARQTTIDRTMALKMLKPTALADPEQAGKFLAEAIITGVTE